MQAGDQLYNEKQDLIATSKLRKCNNILTVYISVLFSPARIFILLFLNLASRKERDGEEVKIKQGCISPFITPV